MKAKVVLILLLACVCAGCYRFTPDIPPLECRTRCPCQAAKQAWLENVVVDSTSFRGSVAPANVFTGEILEFLRQSGCFNAVNILPGKVVPGDVVLSFRLKPFLIERGVHPAYYPCAFFTVGLYIFLGGPIVRDTFNVTCNMTARDAHGTVFYDRSLMEKYKRSYSFWSFGGGPDKRLSGLISELLQEMVRDFGRKGGAHDF